MPGQAGLGGSGASGLDVLAESSDGEAVGFGAAGSVVVSALMVCFDDDFVV